MLRNRVPVLAAAAVLLSLTAPLEAQTEDPEYESRILSDKITLRLGSLVSDFKTDIAAGNILGVALRLEDVLGFDDELTTASLSGTYRLGTKNKHAIGFGFGTFDRSSSGTITGTIPIFDEDFVGSFSSNFDVRIFGLTYRYSFVNTGKTEAGFNAGLATYDFKFAIEGSIQIGTPMNPTIEARRESVDFLAPLPSLGFYINYAIKPNLIVGMSNDALDLDLGDVSGRLLNSNVEFSWYFSKYVGVGLGLSSTDINYDNTDKGSGDRLKVDYSQTGVSLFLTFGF